MDITNRKVLTKGIAFYCTDYRDGISRETGETYAMTTAKKMQAAAENGKLRLAQAPVATDADLFSGHDTLMPPGKTADIVHWSHSGYHVRDALGAARNDPRAIEAGLHGAVCNWARLLRRLRIVDRAVTARLPTEPADRRLLQPAQCSSAISFYQLFTSALRNAPA